MASSAKATIRLEFKSQKELATILEALKPEANSPLNRRSKTSLASDGKFLVLTVEAEDTVALRAALNAYLRWIGSAANVVEMLKKT